MLPNNKAYQLFKTRVGFKSAKNLKFHRNPTKIPKGQARSKREFSQERLYKALIVKLDRRFCKREGVILEHDDRFYSKNLAALKPHIYGSDLQDKLELDTCHPSTQECTQTDQHRSMFDGHLVENLHESIFREQK
uniref:Uncharacterized protein n=1 Tax=Euplotes harpa TaxID=151035 RepID=A0A7S3JIT4_9SPIT|mmetsp:Transcript_39301/g.45102  ORF Transcript_39301/g.45102 Transcript_39301/m.45102 type:complete len:135 (+) Transcript_39301:15-419(+)